MELSRKLVGQMGEQIAAHYLGKQGFTVIGRNIARKTGELDIVAKKQGTLHIVEVKTVSCAEFPTLENLDQYDPADNLHAYKKNTESGTDSRVVCGQYRLGRGLASGWRTGMASSAG